MLSLDEIKILLIEAHRTQSWERAKELSQLKEKAKKKARRYPKCADCGRTCSANRCMRCSQERRYGPRRIFTKVIFALCLIALIGCKSSSTFTDYNTLTAPPPLPALLAKVAAHKPLAVAKLVAPTPTNHITLGWNPVTNYPPVSNYRIYQGSISRTYTNIYDFGIALIGVVNAAQGTNYFAATATASNLESGYSAELVVAPIAPKPILLYIDTFVQTNSTLNSNLWGNVAQFPTIILTNPPSPIYGRTLIQMNYH